MERRELPRYPVIDAAATDRNLRRLRLEKGYSVKELQEYLGLGCPQGVYQFRMTVSQPLPRNRNFWNSKRVKLDYSTETSCDNRLLETTCAASAYFVKSGFSMGSMPIARPNMTMAHSLAMGALGANAPLLP